jgi:hypothetical protein
LLFSITVLVVRGESMAHQITITWTASTPPVSGYNIYRGTAHGNESSLSLNSSPITATTYTDNAVFAGQTYSYLVKAVYSGVESVGGIDVTSAPVPFGNSPVPLDLGAASSFEVLAATTVTNVPATATLAAGDIGVSPGTSMTGFATPASISGVFHAGDFVSAAAQTSAGAAFTAGMALTGGTTTLADIGSSQLSPGVYTATTSLAITGPVVLDAHGDVNAAWVFQIGSTLTTAANNSYVILLGGAQAANVFWLVGSSATLGTNTVFAGNIIAQVSITATTGALINGRLLARTGAVTLDTNEIIMFQANGLPLPPSGLNVPPLPPAAPANLLISSEA